MHMPPTGQSVCWVVFDPKMSCCKWLQLSLEFNFAVRQTNGHTEPRYAKLWRHNDIIYARYYHVTLLSTNLIVPSMMSQWPAAVGQQFARVMIRSGRNVRSFCSRCGRHDTLLLLIVIAKVLVECIIAPALSYVPVRFYVNRAIKMQKLSESFCRTGNIYSCRHYGHHNQKIMITFQIS